MSSPLNFAWGVADPWIQAQPQLYTPAVLQTLRNCQPNIWRIEVPWSSVASSLAPGPYQARAGLTAAATITGSGFVGTPQTNGSRDVRATITGTGTVTGAAPGAQNRNWAIVDVAVNNIRLYVGCDILIFIGQGMPSGWTDANYQSFCAEVAQRYGPGGPGIRTDGVYAPLAGWGVKNYEFWNEENASNFWTSNVNPKDYTNLLKAGYQGIKSVLPGSQSVCVFGGMQHVQFIGAWYGYGWGTQDEYSFFQACLSYGAAGYFDAVGTHLYPGAPPDVAETGTTVGSMQLPGGIATGNLVANARITGSGGVNITASRSGALNVGAQISGSGVVPVYQPGGPVPNIMMDNFRQIQAIYALMQNAGVGNLPIWITESGYCVNASNMTPTLQSTYIQGLFAILNTLPYIQKVFIYNALDANNSNTNDGYTGYGLLDYNGNPRPIYYWLQQQQVLSNGGSLAVAAQISGTGGISGAAAATVTATGTGSGIITKSGGIITATITGTGQVSPAGQAIDVITATILGAGNVGVYGAGGLGGSGGQSVQFQAVGLGKVGVAPGNGDSLVVATITGSGSVVSADGQASTVTATITGSGQLINSGQEVGVVGLSGGGSLTATTTGAGSGGIGVGGGIVLTETITGSGVVGTVTGGTSSVTDTATGSGTVGAVGAGVPAITATITGVGVVGLVGSGSLTVTNTGSGGETFFGSGSSSITDTATGAGAVGTVTGGTLSVTDTITGAGARGYVGGGTPSITATITGAGVVGVVGGGTLTVTSTPGTTAQQGPMRCFWIGAGSSAGNSKYALVNANFVYAWSSFENSVNNGTTQTPLSDACVITGIKVWVTTAPGGATSWTFALRKNASTTAASLTISGSNTSAAWNGAISCSQLDLIDLLCTSSGSPAGSGNTYWIVEYFTPYSATYSGNYFLSPYAASTSYGGWQTMYWPIMGTVNSAPTGTASVVEGTVPMSMTAVRIAGVANEAIGSGTSYTWSVYKVNGGTTGPAVTITNTAAGAAQVGSAGSQAYSAGDLIAIQSTFSSNPAWSIMQTCVTLVPGTFGQMPLIYSGSGAPSTSATNYEELSGWGAGWNATESSVLVFGAPVTLQNMYVTLNTAPGSGKSWAFTLRKASANTALTCTVSNTNTTASDTSDSVSVNEGDSIDMAIAPSGTPASTSGARFSMVQVIPQNTVGV